MDGSGGVDGTAWPRAPFPIMALEQQPGTCLKEGKYLPLPFPLHQGHIPFPACCWDSIWELSGGPACSSWASWGLHSVAAVAVSRPFPLLLASLLQVFSASLEQMWGGGTCSLAIATDAVVPVVQAPCNPAEASRSFSHPQDSTWKWQWQAEVVEGNGRGRDQERREGEGMFL